MPVDTPPPPGVITPATIELPTWTRLWRVHKHALPSCAFRPGSYDPAAYDPRLGGRFDPTPEDPHPYLYAALSPQAAVYEALMRDVSFAGHYRHLPQAHVSGRSLSTVVASVPLKLISLLTISDLAAAGQDAWLVMSEPSQFRATRAWARHLRAEVPDAQGIIWRPGALLAEDCDDRRVILFGDRLDQGAIRPAGSTALDTAAGMDRLNEYLVQWRAVLGSPRPGRQAQEATAAPAESDGDVLPDFESFYKASFRAIRKITYAVTLDMDLATEATDRALEIASRKWEDVAGMAKPVSYVAVIACNIARRARRKRTAQGDISLDARADEIQDKIQPWPGTSASPDGLVSRIDLERALRAIPAAQAECFLLHYLSGYAIREIAASQGVAEGTVKSRLHAARKALRELLGDYFNEGGTR